MKLRLVILASLVVLIGSGLGWGASTTVSPLGDYMAAADLESTDNATNSTVGTDSRFYQHVVQVEWDTKNSTGDVTGGYSDLAPGAQVAIWGRVDGTDYYNLNATVIMTTPLVTTFNGYFESLVFAPTALNQNGTFTVHYRAGN